MNGFKAFLGLVLFISQASADGFIAPRRIDPSVPASCSPGLKSFRETREAFMVSVQGAVSHGYTHEVAITRQEAGQLWSAVKKGKPYPRPGGRAGMFFEILEREARQGGFTYEKDGDVFEALAIDRMRQVYAPNEYVITGGWAYRGIRPNRQPTPELGELDLVVVRKSDCAVIAYGEAKLGVDNLPKARDQIARFRSYLKSMLCLGERLDPAATVCRLP